MSTTDAARRIDPADSRSGPSANVDPRRARRVRLFQVTFGLLAVVAVGFIVWESSLKYRVIAKRWGVVVPGQIYRSGQLSRYVLEDRITRNGIQEVIDLNGVEPEDLHQAFEIEWMKQSGLTHHRFALGGDGRGDIRRYAAAIETLVNATKSGKPILVHCSAGTQRTGGVVACYRVLIEGRSTEEARAELQSFGWRPRRDTELIPYLNENLATLASLLVERGILKEPPNPMPVFRP